MSTHNIYSCGKIRKINFWLLSLLRHIFLEFFFLCFHRIEKVIEDLENIKETVNQKSMGEDALDTARPDSVTPVTHR